MGFPADMSSLLWSRRKTPTIRPDEGETLASAPLPRDHGQQPAQEAAPCQNERGSDQHAVHLESLRTEPLIGGLPDGGNAEEHHHVGGSQEQ